MPEMKTLNGYEVVDAKAREDIKGIQAAVEAIPEYDLTSYATKSELPTKVSQLQNDSRFITLEEVPETDLSAYAKKSDIPDVSGFITSIPSEYVTESELNAKGYLTQHQDISHLAPKTSIPTKVSQLANDSNYLTSIPSNYITEAELEAKGYLTEHQSLAAYATKTYVDNTVAENQPDLSGYAKKTDIPDVSGFISEIPSEYVTDSELTAKGYLAEADLSEYAKKSEIPTVPTKTSQLTNDSNFLTAVPSEYVTETELDNKGYLTQHQSLEGYATKTYVDNAIAGIDIPGGTSKEVVEIPYSNTFPTAMQDKLKEIWLYGVAGNNILDKYDIYIIDADNKTSCKANSVYCYGSETDSDIYKRFTVSAQKSEAFLFSCTINPYTSKINRYMSEGLVTRGYLESNFASSNSVVQLRWKQASDLTDSELYSATEIYVLGSDSGELSSCYAYLKTSSGPGTEFVGAQCIPLVSYKSDNSASSLAGSNMPYIKWMGWGFETNNFSVVAVFYKS